MRSPSPTPSRQRRYSQEQHLSKSGSSRTGNSSSKGYESPQRDYNSAMKGKAVAKNAQDMDMDMDVDTETSQFHREHSHSPTHSRHSSDTRDLGIDLNDTQSEPRTPIESSSSSSNLAKRPKRNPSVKCPICHEIVAPGQYQQHYRMELALIENGSSLESTRGKRGAAIAATKHITKGKSRASGVDYEKRTLVRDVQKRRAARQNNKDSPTPTGGSSSGNLDLGLVGALAGDSIGDEDSPATCFICNERLYGSLEDINSHIDACLTNPQPAHHVANASGPSRGNTPASNSGRSSVATTPSTHVVDSFEEYTWAGQTRVRATALFEGGMGSLGSGSRSVQEDIDDDLDIEDDEEDEYGGAQFTERDVVQNEVDPDAEELREIVIASSSAVQRPPSPPPRQRKLAVSSTPSSSFDREVDIEDMGDDPGDVDDTVIDEDAEIDLEGDGDENGDAVEEEDERESDRVNALISSAFASGDTKLVIEALRAKIKHLESANKNAPTCLICLDPYTVPLTSIVCWHVHCEACWMKTLGSKKLCPQCQKITLPKDLRRIYL